MVNQQTRGNKNRFNKQATSPPSVTKSPYNTNNNNNKTKSPNNKKIDKSPNNKNTNEKKPHVQFAEPVVKQDEEKNQKKVKETKPEKEKQKKGTNPTEEKVDKVEKVEKVGKVDKTEKPEKADKVEKVEKVEKIEKIEKKKAEISEKKPSTTVPTPAPSILGKSTAPKEATEPAENRKRPAESTEENPAKKPKPNSIFHYLLFYLLLY